MIKFPISAILRSLDLVALLLPVALTSAPLPFAQFYEQPNLALPVVSPNGKVVALRAEIDETQYLAIMDAATMQFELSADFKRTRLAGYAWKGDNLLLMIIANENGSSDLRTFDLKTKKVKFLSNKLQYRSARILSFLSDHPDDMILETEVGYRLHLVRLNVHSGKTTDVEKPSVHLSHWLVDRRGNPVAALGGEHKRQFLQWRSEPGAEWQRHDLGPIEKPEIIPFAVHSDQRRLLALDRTGDGPAVLIALDPITMKKETIFQNSDVPVEEMRSWSQDSTMTYGFLYEDDRPRIHFIDDDAARTKAVIDKALPDTFNDILSSSADHNVLAVHASSDRDPGSNFLFDRRTGRLAAYGPTYANVQPAEMGSSRPFTFKTNDGLTIRGRLWLPPGNPSKPPLLVSLGHGLAGPRSRYAFSVRNQIFATRGYAVAQIDYRGHEGFGARFLRAGDYQFNSGMVDDLLTGIDFLIAQGWVDENRIGLMTRSWGGIVGLQVLAKSNRFKVWVNDGSLLASASLDVSDLSLSSSDNDKITAELGGRAAAKKYLQSLDPKLILPQLRIPSFHFYERSHARTLNEDADLIASLIRSPAPLPEIPHIYTPENEKPRYAAEFVGLERMFTFLKRELSDSLAAN